MGWRFRVDGICLINVDNGDEVWKKTYYKGSNPQEDEYKLMDVFKDPRNPTEEEVILFELDTGRDFPSLALYKKYMNRMRNQ